MLCSARNYVESANAYAASRSAICFYTTETDVESVALGSDYGACSIYSSRRHMFVREKRGEAQRF